VSEPEAVGQVPAQEHHVAISRTARYYTLGSAAGAREVWFLIHGYSQLARRFLRHFRPLAAPGRLLVAPEALNRYYSEYAPGYHRPDARIGATWMTREDRLTEIADYVHYLDRLYDVIFSDAPAPPPRRVLLGFSQGAITAARWAALGLARFQHIILWGGFPPPELPRRPDVFHGAELTLVWGRSDAYADAGHIDAESAALLAAGVTHRLCWFDGGHQLDDATLQRLAAGS
jgi:predicted esterase